jgi:hypothetical protein
VSLDWRGSDNGDARQLPRQDPDIATATFYNITSTTKIWTYNVIVTAAKPARFSAAAAGQVLHLSGAIWDRQLSTGDAGQQVVVPAGAKISLGLRWDFTDLAKKPVAAGRYYLIFVAHGLPDGIPGYISTATVDLN